MSIEKHTSTVIESYFSDAKEIVTSTKRLPLNEDFKALEESVGNEGFSEFIDVIIRKFDSGLVENETGWFSALFKVNKVNSDFKVLRSLERLDRHHLVFLNPLKIQVPSHLNSYLLNYIDDLDEAIKATINIEKRIYDPLLKWSSEVLSLVGKKDMMFPDNVNIVDTDKLTKTLQGHFRKSDINTREQAQKEFEKTFKRPRDVTESLEVLSKMVRMVESVNLNTLIKKETQLVKNVRELVNDKRFVNFDKRNLTKFSVLMSQITKEVAFFGFLIHSVDVCIESVNQTQVVIKQKLKQEGVY